MRILLIVLIPLLIHIARARGAENPLDVQSKTSFSVKTDKINQKLIK